MVVTSKNWYRMLLKTCKDIDNLIYWNASPVENCALKALPVQQQAQLFRVMLEHWLTKCHPEVDQTEDQEDSEAHRFQIMGYDDKGDCYWRFAGRLYREEIPVSAPSTEAPEELDSTDEPQRSARQKHKRERLAVTESASFLRRTLLEPTTRSTRNSVVRFANDLFLEEERIAGRNERLRQESLGTFESRTGLPLRWLGKSDHITTLAIERESIEALLFILKTGTSERMKDLVKAIEQYMLPTIGNGAKTKAEKRSKSKVEASRNAKKAKKEDSDKEDEVEEEVKEEEEEKENGEETEEEDAKIEEKEVKDEEVEEMVKEEVIEEAEVIAASPPSSPRRPARRTRSRAAVESSPQASAPSSRAPSPTPETATTATTTVTGSTESLVSSSAAIAVEEPTQDGADTSSDSMDVSEPENGNGDPEIDDDSIGDLLKVANGNGHSNAHSSLKDSENGDDSTPALKEEESSAMNVDETISGESDADVAMSDAEDSAITALMGAVVSEESNGRRHSSNRVKEEESKVNVSVRSNTSNASSSPDTSLMLDAPRQKRQAAVKSRQMLSNGLHNGSVMDDALARQDRKRPRSATDELVLRLRITPQVRRAIRAEMEEEEPVRKKPSHSASHHAHTHSHAHAHGHPHAHAHGHSHAHAERPPVFRAPSPPRRPPRHIEPTLANLEEEALSVLSTTPSSSNSLVNAMMPNLAALGGGALGGLPYGGYNPQMLAPFMYGNSPYLQAFSQLGGFGIDPMALLAAGYNPLLAAGGGMPTQEMLLQQQRQQFYQQQLIEAHLLQQQQLMLQQRLAQQHPGLQIDPTRISVPLNNAAGTITVSVPVPETPAALPAAFLPHFEPNQPPKVEEPPSSNETSPLATVVSIASLPAPHAENNTASDVPAIDAAVTVEAPAPAPEAEATETFSAATFIPSI